MYMAYVRDLRQGALQDFIDHQKYTIYCKTSLDKVHRKELESFPKIDMPLCQRFVGLLFLVEFKLRTGYIQK